MRFYLDEFVPAAIRDALRLRGLDVLTAHDDGLDGFDDGVILDRATTLDRILYTEDPDILAEADLRRSAGVPFTGIVLAHPLESAIGQRTTELVLLAGRETHDSLAGRVAILPRRD